MDDSSLCCTSGNSETASSGDHDRVDELSFALSGQLKINDGHRVDTTNDERRAPVERYYVEEEDEGEDEDEDDFSEKDLLAQMGYAKSDPSRDYEEEEEEEEDLSEDSILARMGYLKNEPPKHEPTNIPIAELNLVSALKGSREKEGNPAEECRVSWALDVYDPPCTSDDHFAQTKTERHTGVQKAKGLSGKNKQKGGGKGGGEIEGRVGGGKGSRGGGSKGNEGGAKAGGGSKDKKKAEKKHKKHGGSSSKYSGPGE